MHFNNTQFALLFFVSIIFSSCNDSSNKTMSDQEREEIEVEIRESIVKYQEVRGKGYKHFTDFRANVEGYTLAENGKMVFDNFDHRLTYSKEAFENKIKTYLSINMINDRLHVLDRNAAVLTFEFESTYVTLSEDTIVYDGAWTYVLQKIAGEWKAVHENGTVNRP